MEKKVSKIQNQEIKLQRFFISLTCAFVCSLRNYYCIPLWLSLSNIDQRIKALLEGISSNLLLKLFHLSKPLSIFLRAVRTLPIYMHKFIFFFTESQDFFA